MPRTHRSAATPRKTRGRIIRESFSSGVKIRLAHLDRIRDRIVQRERARLLARAVTTEAMEDVRRGDTVKAHPSELLASLHAD